MQSYYSSCIGLSALMRLTSLLYLYTSGKNKFLRALERAFGPLKETTQRDQCSQ